MTESCWCQGGRAAMQTPVARLEMIWQMFWIGFLCGLLVGLFAGGLFWELT